MAIGLTRTILGLCALCVISTATPARACSVPVFRYALERWQSDPYEVIIFHRGELPADLKRLADRFSPRGSAGEKFANMRSATVDLDDLDPESRFDREMAQLWELQQTEELPRVVVRYPYPGPVNAVVWAGAPDDEMTKTLIESPLRKQIAQQLLAGHTAVWVLLESGDESKDDAAYQKLSERLAHGEKTLKLPEIAEEDIAAGLVNVDPDALKISFPIERLSRKTAQERFFVEMLLGSESDLRSPEFIDEPMVFPIFGRGRALYALIGKGINNETIAIACETLIGPCTCQIKGENPGTDLLMAVDWDTLVAPTFDSERELPPLPGLAAPIDLTEPRPALPIDDANSATSDATSSDAEGAPVVASVTGGPNPRARRSNSVESSSDESSGSRSSDDRANPGAESTPSGRSSTGLNSMVRNVLILCGMGVLLVVGFSVFLAKK